MEGTEELGLGGNGMEEQSRDYDVGSWCAGLSDGRHWGGKVVPSRTGEDV